MRPSAPLCLSAAFSSSLTSATDSQDMAVAQSKVSAILFSVAGLLGRQMQPLQHLPDSINISSASQRAALQRLQQRAQHAGVHAFDIIVNGDLQQWESMICASLAAGMSLQLLPSTVQDQVCQVLLASAPSLLNVLATTAWPDQKWTWPSVYQLVSAGLVALRLLLLTTSHKLWGHRATQKLRFCKQEANVERC
jgi:hypothetical protein